MRYVMPFTVSVSIPSPLMGMTVFANERSVWSGFSPITMEVASRSSRSRRNCFASSITRLFAFTDHDVAQIANVVAIIPRFQVRHLHEFAEHVQYTRNVRQEEHVVMYVTVSCPRSVFFESERSVPAEHVVHAVAIERWSVIRGAWSVVRNDGANAFDVSGVGERGVDHVAFEAELGVVIDMEPRSSGEFERV